MSGETISLHYWNITYHSRVFLPDRYLDLGLSMQTTQYQDSEMICTIFANFASLLMVATFVFLWFTVCRRCDNKRRGKRRKLGSSVWTRRKVYWLHKRVSRTEYIGFALRNKSAASPQYSSDSCGDGSSSDGETDVQICANIVQECPAFHNHRMRYMFIICLGIMACYGLLSVQPDNFTHPSCSRVPHQYLGVGLGGQINYRYYWNINAHYRPFFLKPTNHFLPADLFFYQSKNLIQRGVLPILDCDLE